ncbi:MAG: CARDB domain-containing protein [Verrucomicrobiota bacterium]|jgi:hypothetical protein
MKNLRFLCSFVLLAVFVALLTEPVWAACDDSISALVTVDTRFVDPVIGTCGNAQSGVITVDTRSSFSISGRVVDDRSGLGLAGVTVQLGGGGASATTAANGAFMVSGGSFGEGSQLQVSKAGYATLQQTVPAGAGTRHISLPDIALRLLPAGSQPVVTSIQPRLDGLFLSGTGIVNDYSASVNWNGGDPGEVAFYVNGQLVETVVGERASYTVSLNLDDWFSPSFRTDANYVSVVATSSGGVDSQYRSVNVLLLPLPEALFKILGLIDVYETGHIAADFEIPKPPIKTVLNLPVLGKFGVEMAVNGSFDYTLTDGDWELALGFGAEGKRGKRGRRPKFPFVTRYPKMKLYLGNKEISFQVQGKAHGTATFNSGITLSEILVQAAAEGKFEVWRVGLLDIVPGLSGVVAHIPILSELTKPLSVILWARVGAEADVDVQVQPTFGIQSLEGTGLVGLDAAYEPDLGVAKLKVYVGGEPSFTLQYPGELLKRLRFRAYAGASFDAWILSYGPEEYVFVDVSWPETGAKGSSVLKLKANLEPKTWRVRDRQYLKAGKEQFVVYQPTARSMAGGGDGLDALTRFRLMGDRPIGIREGQPRYAQADLPVIENVFPNSDPSLAGSGQELMLLYVADTGVQDTIQFTETRWTYFDGANWTDPAPIDDDPRGDFAPQVRFDGNGDAIAVWTRIADPAFEQEDLTAMASQLEIVWSRWSHTTGAWSVPIPLTDNQHLDHSPLLAGPVADGDLVLVWVENQANELGATGEPGALQNDRIIGSRWDSLSGAWETPGLVMGPLTSRGGHDLSATGESGLYVWSQDIDGDPETLEDQEVFAREWTGGEWGQQHQLTDDDVADRGPRAVSTAEGESILVWLRGSDLVMQEGLAGEPQIVRAGSDSIGFIDFECTLGPGGNLVLLWQENSPDGADAYYSVYDPESRTWSRDDRLFEDAPLERSFAAVWDIVGNLTVAYNKVTMRKVTKSVMLEDGQLVEIPNIPEADRVDLLVTKRALIKDLAIEADGFRVEGGNYLPGDRLVFSARVNNTGNIALDNLLVRFFDGDPEAGGLPVADALLEGWLEGAADQWVTAEWTLPEPAAPHRFWAVIDPDGTITEFDELNNAQSVAIGGTDLALRLISSDVREDGSMQVVAEVRNGGAPGSPQTLLAIRQAGAEGPPLASVDVIPLDAGELAQVVLDLPSGTHPEGDAVFTMLADEAGVANDIDLGNNEVRFSSSLFIDRDGDQMADGWETQYGLDPDLPDDALEDPDGDGMSNLHEFWAGTDPTDPASYLFVMPEPIMEGGSAPQIRIIWGSAAGRLYSIEWSNDLETWQPVREHIQATPPVNEWLAPVPGDSPNGFFRVVVE